MKNEIICKLMQDLLPNYLEGLTSPESSEAIATHLKQCPDCQAIFVNMKQDIETPQAKTPESQTEDRNIKPFMKLRKKVRNAIIATVLICILIFGGGTYYFAHGFIPGSKDITMTCENFDGMVNITFTAKSKNITLDSYVGGYHKGGSGDEFDYVEMVAYHKNPFKKAIRENAYFGYTFLDENTVYDSSGNKQHITKDDYFLVQLKDTQLKINIKDLYHGKLTVME